MGLWAEVVIIKHISKCLLLYKNGGVVMSTIILEYKRPELIKVDILTDTQGLSLACGSIDPGC